MTAAKVMDVIARLPGSDGQPADAVSAYTQVKLKDAPRLLTLPKSECPDVRIRLPRQKWPKSWANIEDPAVPLGRNFIWTTYLLVSCGKDSSKKFYWDLDGTKVPNWACLFVRRKQGLFL